MKSLFFDLYVCQPMLGSKFHGGGEYIKAVFYELCRNYSERIEISVFYDPNRFLDDWILSLIDEKNINMYEISTYDELRNISAFQETDVIFAGLLRGIEKVAPSNARLIGVYHGFRILEKPADKTAPLYEATIKGTIKEWLKYHFSSAYAKRHAEGTLETINRCSDIIGVSNHSVYSARVLFPSYNKDKIHMFYSPQKRIAAASQVIRNDKVILMLGGNRWVKNVYRGIVAIDQLFSNGQLNGYTVHVVGGIPPKIKKRIKNIERFVPLGYLEPEELELEYSTCDFFFYPSLNEGFGYPPQEVMRYGKTCVISAVTSLTEIYGDSVYYCNPYDIEEMKTRLLFASEIKIDESIVYAKHAKVSAKQDEDLKKLCELIID